MAGSRIQNPRRAESSERREAEGGIYKEESKDYFGVQRGFGVSYTSSDCMPDKGADLLGFLGGPGTGSQEAVSGKSRDDDAGRSRGTRGRRKKKDKSK